MAGLAVYFDERDTQLIRVDSGRHLTWRKERKNAYQGSSLS